MVEFLKNYLNDFLCGFQSFYNTLNLIYYACSTRQTERHTDRILLSAEEYKLLFIYFIGWVVIYILIEIFVKVNLKLRKDINDIKNRLVSIIHATLIFWMAFYDLIYNHNSKCGETNYQFQNKTIIPSTLAYFLYDLIVSIILDLSDIQMVAHHLICISAYYYCLAFNTYGIEIVVIILITEVTAPIMHIRMILKNYNLKNTKVYEILDYLYIYCYFIFRVGFFTPHVLIVIICPTNPLILKILTGLLFLQGLLFSKRMISYILAKNRAHVERKSKNIELYWLAHNKEVETLDYYIKNLKKSQSYIP